MEIITKKGFFFVKNVFIVRNVPEYGESINYWHKENEFLARKNKCLLNVKNF